MADPITEDSKKFYSQRDISIATFFGGPLAAGFLVKKNYETMGLDGPAKRSLIIGILSTILLVAGLIALPEHVTDQIPVAILPGIYTGIIYLIVEKLQGPVLNQHKAGGGAFYSGWNAAGTGLVAMVILISFVAVTAFMAGDLTKRTSGFNQGIYDEGVAVFMQNQEKATAVFNVFETADPRFLVDELNKGIALWKENKQIILRLDTLSNLPVELKVQDAKLIRYSELRMQHNTLLVKALMDNTDRYSPQIDSVWVEIDRVLAELN